MEILPPQVCILLNDGDLDDMLEGLIIEFKHNKRAATANKVVMQFLYIIN